MSWTIVVKLYTFILCKRHIHKCFIISPIWYIHRMRSDLWPMSVERRFQPMRWTLHVCLWLEAGLQTGWDARISSGGYPADIRRISTGRIYDFPTLHLTYASVGASNVFLRSIKRIDIFESWWTKFNISGQQRRCLITLSACRPSVDSLLVGQLVFIIFCFYWLMLYSHDIKQILFLLAIYIWLILKMWFTFVSMFRKVM